MSKAAEAARGARSVAQKFDARSLTLEGEPLPLGAGPQG